MTKSFRGFHLFRTFKPPYGASVDVTYRCNLNCLHCYFKKQKYHSEISVKEWLPILKKLRQKGIIHMTWVGGEPLLREKLIKQGKNFFPFNYVITNGTISLPNWKEVSFGVSVDGTEKIHNEIRGAEIYKQVKKNANRDDIKVYIACVLNMKNYQEPEKMLKEWVKTKVKGIIFDFYTPLQKSDPLWIRFKLRDKVIDNLKNLKREYKDFMIWNTERTLELMKSNNCQNVTKNCLIPRDIISLDPMGNKKEPCILGKVDCRKCGCIITYLTAATHQWNYDTIKGVYKTLC